MSPCPVQANPDTIPPLQGVARVGMVKVHVPFSLAELFQIEKNLGSYISNSTTFIKEIQYIIQSYHLTFYGIYIILTNNLLPEKRR